MPNRIIRDGILTSERVNEIAGTPAVECTYRRLQSVVDDFGRFSAHSSILRAALYPLRLDQYTDAEIVEHLNRCAAANLIRLYQVNGKSYVEVLDFNQRTRAMRSRYPSPDGHASVTERSGGQQVTAACPSNDRHAPDCGAPRDPHQRTETETETEAEAEAEAEASRRFGFINPWEQFVAAYPECKRRVKVEPACRAYAGRVSSDLGEHKRLMDGLARHLGSDSWCRSLRDNGGRYIPSMERFIADGLYLDSPPAFKSEAVGSKDRFSEGLKEAMQLIQEN
jgi:hypothetical protein